MNTTISGNVLIVKVDGDLDHNTANSIRKKIDSELKKNPINLLIMDLSTLNFMDSSGIGLILGRYKLINSLGGKLCLVKPNESIGRIINMSGLHKILSIYSSVEEALDERGIEIGKYN